MSKGAFSQYVLFFQFFPIWWSIVVFSSKQEHRNPLWENSLLLTSVMSHSDFRFYFQTGNVTPALTFGFPLF